MKVKLTGNMWGSLRGQIKEVIVKTIDMDGQTWSVGDGFEIAETEPPAEQHKQRDGVTISGQTVKSMSVIFIQEE